MTLAHFAVWYNTVSGNKDEVSEDTSGCLPCFQLQNNNYGLYYSETSSGLLESASNDT